MAYYEMNVAKNGKHYFATASRSITVKQEAEAMMKHFLVLFPESEGYEVTCTYWTSVGYSAGSLEDLRSL